MSTLRSSRVIDPAAEREALHVRLRSTGAQGGRIDPHRAIATLDLGAMDVGLAVLMTAAFTAAYVAALPVVNRLWTALFAALAPPLGLGGVIGHRTTVIASLVPVTVPYFATHAAAPSPLEWWVALLATVVAVAASTLLRDRWLPLGYGLRFAGCIQVTALAFFAIAPSHFPYDLPSYISGMMLIGATLAGIVPMVYGLTFYLIDVGWERKAALTVLTMGHLLLFVPLQYALQAALIRQASLVMLPVSFIMFGILPEVMVLVAMFGWGMSWRPLRARSRR